MKRISPEKLAEWEALAEAATPGPFFASARTAVPALIAEVRFLTDDLASACEALTICYMQGAASRDAEVRRLEAELESAQSPDLVAQVARAEAAEAQVAALTRERDEARAYANSANYEDLCAIRAALNGE